MPPAGSRRSTESGRSRSRAPRAAFAFLDHLAMEGEVGLVDRRAIHPFRGAGEQFGLLVCRFVFFYVFERVPQAHVIAAEAVDREVALEHAALGAERSDRGFDVG